jgi:hypothetical protein
MLREVIIFGRMVGQFFDMVLYFLHCSGEAGLVVAGGEAFEEGEEPGHLLFECVEGLIAVEDADWFPGKDFAGVVADVAAGGARGELVDIVPFLFGEADVEAAEAGVFGGGVIIHG